MIYRDNTEYILYNQLMISKFIHLQKVCFPENNTCRIWQCVWQINFQFCNSKENNNFILRLQNFRLFSINLLFRKHSNVILHFSLLKAWLLKPEEITSINLSINKSWCCSFKRQDLYLWSINSLHIQTHAE